ncbi:MAG: response regulator transcription factor [Acidobacteria bacterium]|nr:response regulator transcription factor [Acidobacteriota bacterium]MCA1637159.1 response regulator transcription factor [Acidobacteriota bacterium]
MSEITLIIADDHPIVRQGLRQAIEADAALKVLTEASDGRAALEAIAKYQPQVAVLDIDMPLMDGFAVARAVREKKLNVEMVFLTIQRDEDMVNEAVNLGVKGYVLKDSALTDIVSCIKSVARGQHYASSVLTSYLIKRSSRAAALTKEKNGIKDLTPTERRVLKLIAEYKTSKEIAEELFISYRTVETHRANICQKLDLKGSHVLIKFALAHKSELL